MESVFLKILNMSVTASYVIAAVLLLRLLLRRLPKKISYLLWSVVAFRLCCPVTWQSVFSLFSLKPLTAASTQVNVGGTTRLEHFPSNIGTVTPPQVNAGTSVPQVNEAVSTTPLTSMDPLQIGLTIAAIVWCAGIAALLLYSIVCYVRMCRQMRTAIRLRENIYQSDCIRSPFILGLIHPKIYIPFGLDEGTMNYVLEHERYHIKRRDYLIKPFAFLLLTVHWFNPLCWLSFYLMNRDMEMSCDEKVIGKGRNRIGAYSTTLLSFAVTPRFPAPSPLAFGETSVKSRIKNVLNWRKPKTWAMLLAVALCSLAVLACAANPKQQTGSDLMRNASPGTSALSLYVYDGETVTLQTLYDSTAEVKLLDSISSVSAEQVDDWSPEQIAFPVYGLEIGRTDGWSVQGAWSNGYWITQDGTAYRFDYDFESLETDYSWTNRRTCSTEGFPCARFLCQDGNSWHSAMLSPAGELSPPENITAELTTQTAGTLTVKLSNHGTEEWMYGESYSIHVLLDEIWYVVPVMSGNFIFHSIGYMLSAGETQEETYSFSGAMYSALPTGNYRLVIADIAVPFTIQ